jgi:hypothetical protein
MPLSKILLSAFATLFLASAAFAGDAPVTPPMGMQAGFAPGLCRGVMRYLTPEERMMHWQVVQNAIGEMTINQARAYRSDECTKYWAMSSEERQKYAASLKAKWDALPESEKMRLYHQALEFRGGMGLGRGW